MNKAKSALQTVHSISDLDEVAEHLDLARVYSSDPNLSLVCALFQSSDKQAIEQIHTAASLGSVDAQKLIALLDEHSNNLIHLQKSCFDFQRVLNHARSFLLSTNDWNHYRYRSVL